MVLYGTMLVVYFGIGNIETIRDSLGEPWLRISIFSVFFFGGDIAKQQEIVGHRRCAMSRSTYVRVAEDGTVIPCFLLNPNHIKQYKTI